MIQQALPWYRTSPAAFFRSEPIAAFAILAALALYQFANPVARYFFMGFACVGALTTAYSIIRFRKPDFNRREYLFIAVLGLYFFSALMSYLLNPTEIALLRVKQFALWSAWGGGAMLIMHHYVPGGISRRAFSAALVISAVVTGSIAIYLFYFVDDDARVAIGPNFPTIFGGIASLNGLICFYLALNEKTSQALRGALCAGLIGALLASYAAGARGAWLGLLIMMPFIVIIQPFARHRVKAVIILLMAAGAVALFFLSDAVALRVDLMQLEISDYFVNNKEFSSIGLRFDSWKGCILTFLEHPVLGVGDDLLGQSFAPLIAAGSITDFIEPFDHVHNDFLQLAFSKGIVGIVTYFALLALPIFIAAPAWRQLALIISITYCIFGMTDVFFKIESPVVYYFFLSVLLMTMKPEPEDQGNTPDSEVLHKSNIKNTRGQVP